MNGDIDAYRDPMDMLHDATQYLDRVRQTLMEADRFEGILQVRSVGELYRQYAGQRRYGIDIQNIGAEIKLRAERRAGELLSTMPKNSGQLFRGDTMIPRDDAPTYSELGLNKQQASRWQRASALPEDLFEQRSYWIPGSWDLRVVYTDAISFYDSPQEPKCAGQHQESHR